MNNKVYNIQIEILNKLANLRLSNQPNHISAYENFIKDRKVAKLLYTLSRNHLNLIRNLENYKL